MQKFILTFIVTIFLFNCSKEETVAELDYNSEREVLYGNLIQIQKNNLDRNGNLINSKQNTIEFTIDEKWLALQNSIQVLNSQGITNQDIIEEFGDLNHPEIVGTALAVTRIVDETAAGNFIIDLETGYNYSNDTYEDLNLLNLSTRNHIVDCALSALGIPAGLIVGAAGSTSTKALLKAARKLATRTLGWIGAGIAIYEFGSCMDRW